MHILRKPSRISKRDQFTNYKTTMIFSPQRSILLIDSRSPYTESINLALASGTRFSSFLFWKASEVTSSRNRLRRVAVTKWYVLCAIWRPAVYAAESELTWPVLIRAGDMILSVQRRWLSIMPSMIPNHGTPNSDVPLAWLRDRSFLRWSKGRIEYENDGAKYFYFCPGATILLCLLQKCPTTIMTRSSTSCASIAQHCAISSGPT
jgi:hypothetical protein